MTTYSVDTYTGDGSKVDFGVNFPFLQRSHVQVYRIDIASQVQTTLTFVDTGSPTGDEYIWVSDELITVGTAPTSGEQLKIQRDTPENDQLVQWVDGSYIVAEDLNESDKQWLYNIQELEDQISAVDASSLNSVTGTTPITVDNTDAENPVIGIDQVDSTVDPNALTSDTDVMSAKAIDLAFRQEVGDGSNYPPAGTTGKTGKLRVDLTDPSNPDLYAWSGGAWKQLPTKGDKGDTGGVGPAPGLQAPPADAVNVPLQPGNQLGQAQVSVDQDSGGDLKFTFGIPVGKTGAQGPDGPTGTAATVTAGSAKQLGYTEPPTVTNRGSTSAAIFDFGIPKGAPQKIVTQDFPPTTIDGEPVKDGDLWLNTENAQLYVYYTDADSSQWLSVSKTGPQGPAATVDVGSTTTAAPGALASVTNSGTTTAAIFDFSIPRGDKGDPGLQGPQGPTATVDVGYSNSIAYTADAYVTNSGRPDAAIFNFGIPRGAPQKIITQDYPPVEIDGDPIKDGDLWLNTANAQLYAYYEDSDSSQWVSVARTGPEGPKGKAATVDAGNTTTLPAGSAASVTNQGTTSAAVFDFNIPRGDKGDQGLQGNAATVDAGTATSLSYKADPTVTNVGSTSAAIFNFGIPKGAPQRCLVQDGPPTQIGGNPVENGDTWYSSKNGQLYVYYKDSDSTQWVSVSKQGPPGVATVGLSPPGTPQIGELFFDESVDKLKVYTTSGWKLAN